MKKYRSALVLLVAFVLLTNCKKGPEDESLSLLTRTNKISQSWRVTSFTVNGMDKLAQSTPFTINSDSCENFNILVIDSSDWWYLFNEDGTYEENRTTMTYRVADDSITLACVDVLSTVPERIQINREGFWLFNNDNRAADQIFLYDTKSNFSVLWELEELSNSLLIFDRFYRNENDVVIEERIVMEP